MIKCNGYTLQVVRLKPPFRWAQKATIGKESRYRLYYYKNDAIAGLAVWTDYKNANEFMRDFRHNFNSLEELKGTEMGK